MVDLGILGRGYAAKIFFVRRLNDLLDFSGRFFYVFIVNTFVFLKIAGWDFCSMKLGGFVWGQ